MPTNFGPLTTFHVEIKGDGGEIKIAPDAVYSVEGLGAGCDVNTDSTGGGINPNTTFANATINPVTITCKVNVDDAEPIPSLIAWRDKIMADKSCGAAAKNNVTIKVQDTGGGDLVAFVYEGCLLTRFTISNLSATNSSPSMVQIEFASQTFRKA